MLPLPQRYYVPDRIRETYKARLQAVDLWDVSADEKEGEKRAKAGPQRNDVASMAFGKEKASTIFYSMYPPS